MSDSANPVLLYDGVCGLCNRLVQFVLRQDTHAHFRFVSLQSDSAAQILHRHGFNPENLDTIYVVKDPGEVAIRSDALIFMLRELGGVWRVAAAVLGPIPKSLRDWGYDFVARHRYRVFGKYDRCMLPERKYQDRFLDT